MEKNQWILDMISDTFNHEAFNTQYRSLAVLGAQSSQNEMAINIIEFLSTMQGFFEDIQNNLAAKDEDETLQALKEENRILKEKNVKYLEELTGMNQNKNLKVCKK